GGINDVLPSFLDCLRLRHAPRQRRDHDGIAAVGLRNRDRLESDADLDRHRMALAGSRLLTRLWGLRGGHRNSLSGESRLVGSSFKAMNSPHPTLPDSILIDNCLRPLLGYTA